MIVGVFDYLGVSAPILPNTFIGGVGATISTKTLLAGKMSISSDNILDFIVDSYNNITCHINTPYTLDASAFNSNHNITHYIDLDGKCTSVGGNGFFDTYNMKAMVFPSVTSIGGNLARCSSSSQESTYHIMSLQSLTPIGATSGNENNFANTNVVRMYTNTANQTNNGGSPDGDLTAINVNFMNIYYVSPDANSPEEVDDLVASNISGSQLDLTWSAPTSVNTIVGYLVFKNGNIQGFTASTSYTVTSLDELTSYSFEVMTFDDKGNISRKSNELIESTIAYVIPTGNIVSYWNFDSDSTDQVGSNDGTDTSMSYVASGGIGNVADFTAGVTSKITVADAANLSFGNSTTDSEFSLLCRVKLSATSGVIQFIRKGAAATLREYVFRYDTGKLQLRLFDQSSGGYIEATFTISLSTATWYEFAGTYNGSSSQSGIELYKDGALLAATKTLSGSYTAMENQSDPLVFGNISDNTTQALNGFEDEAVIFNKKLTALEVYEIYLKHQSGQYLTE